MARTCEIAGSFSGLPRVFLDASRAGLSASRAVVDHYPTATAAEHDVVNDSPATRAVSRRACTLVCTRMQAVSGAGAAGLPALPAAGLQLTRLPPNPRISPVAEINLFDR